MAATGTRYERDRILTGDGKAQSRWISNGLQSLITAVTLVPLVILIFVIVGGVMRYTAMLRLFAGAAVFASILAAWTCWAGPSSGDDALYPLKPAVGESESARANDNIATGPGSSKVPSSPQPPRRTTDRPIARQVAARQLIAAAMEQWQRISDPELKSTACGVIAEAQVKVGDMASAKATATKAEGYSREFIYESICKAEAGMGDVASAKVTAGMMASEYGRRQVGRAIVTAQLKAGDVTGALDTAAHIAHLPDDEAGTRELDEERAYALKEIAAVQIRTGDNRGAIKTLQNATKAAEHMPRTTPPSLHIRLLLEIAAAQAKAGDTTGFAKTLKIVRQVARDYTGRHTPWAYRAIFEAQVMAGDMAGAREEAARVTDRSGPRPDLTAEAYHGIALGQAKSGNLPAAKATASAIAEETPKASVYCDIACLQAGSGDIAGAKATATQIGVNYLKAAAYSDIATVQAKAGNIAEAKKTAAEIREDESRLRTYCGIAEVQAKAGDMAGASETFDEASAIAAQIKNERWTGSAFSLIAEARARAGDYAGAKRVTARISSAFGRPPIYGEIAEMEAKVGNRAAARETLKMAIKDADSLGGDYKTMAYAHIAETLARFGDLDGAKRIAAKVREPPYDSNVTVAIIKAQAEAGDVAGAIGFATRVEDKPFFRCVRLAEAAEALCSDP